MGNLCRFAISLLAFLLVVSCTGPTKTPEQEKQKEQAEQPDITEIPELPISTGPAIHEIQGASHISPYLGEYVENVEGVVTFKPANGFYMQSLEADDDLATSEGIYVFKLGFPKVNPGDIVLVSGTVEEEYPGGLESGGLSITQIKMDEYAVMSSNNPLPQPETIGEGGRTPPSLIIDDDKLEIFEPDSDGIDFYESLESMLIQVVDAIVVGPTNGYNETVILASNGMSTEIISSKNTIVIRENDFNPERIILDDGFRVIPTDLNVGDRLTTPVVGIVDYTYGNFKLQPVENFPYEQNDIKMNTAPAAEDDELSIGSYNVLNLDAKDNQKRFEALADHIVYNLNSPDILALQEIQDNNGTQFGKIVEADETYKMIIDTVLSIGGPIYEFQDIAPLASRDGGEPGGNIRVGFLCRTDRGLSFIHRPGGDATTSAEALMGANGVELTFSPGRIDPTHPAFSRSRKPLVGEFSFNGHTIFVITSHFNSKGGDDSLFGSRQPPFLESEIQRKQQAEVVHDFIASILQLDPNSKIVVLGDLNDFQFSPPLTILKEDVLINLFTTLPEEERFSYIYDGNSQVLDHILVSQTMFEQLISFNVIHINSIINHWDRFSDHDPLVARFILSNK